MNGAVATRVAIAMLNNGLRTKLRDLKRSYGASLYAPQAAVNRPASRLIAIAASIMCTSYEAILDDAARFTRTSRPTPQLAGVHRGFDARSGTRIFAYRSAARCR